MNPQKNVVSPETLKNIRLFPLAALTYREYLDICIKLVRDMQKHYNLDSIESITTINSLPAVVSATELYQVIFYTFLHENLFPEIFEGVESLKDQNQGHIYEIIRILSADIDTMYKYTQLQEYFHKEGISLETLDRFIDNVCRVCTGVKFDDLIITLTSHPDPAINHKDYIPNVMIIKIGHAFQLMKFMSEA